MFPLEKIYGCRSFNRFHESHYDGGSLKEYRDNALGDSSNIPIDVNSFSELLEAASFFSVMNKRHNLYFRGQRHQFSPIPAIFRHRWRSIGLNQHSIPDNPKAREAIYAFLNARIMDIVLSTCRKFPLPRRATLKMFRESVWAIAQHYDLWPTPLVDVTPNLRVAASFALWDQAQEGYVYIVAMPHCTNSITFDADQHIVLARLQAVCPPAAKRPHYQDGYLVGRFPFLSPNPNPIDKNPGEVSDLSRRLIAKIRLKNNLNDSNTRRLFWSDDFPQMSHMALFPDASNDPLMVELMKFSYEIDNEMDIICRKFK